eukprot:scaffold3051_cov175-Amphora_coffeaeformis.AAC.11
MSMPECRGRIPLGSVGVRAAVGQTTQSSSDTAAGATASTIPRHGRGCGRDAGMTQTPLRRRMRPSSGIKLLTLLCRGMRHAAVAVPAAVAAADESRRCGTSNPCRQGRRNWFIGTTATMRHGTC